MPTGLPIHFGILTPPRPAREADGPDEEAPKWRPDWSKAWVGPGMEYEKLRVKFSKSSRGMFVCTMSFPI